MQKRYIYHIHHRTHVIQCVRGIFPQKNKKRKEKQEKGKKEKKRKAMLRYPGWSISDQPSRTRETELDEGAALNIIRIIGAEARCGLLVGRFASCGGYAVSLRVPDFARVVGCKRTALDIIRIIRTEAWCGPLAGRLAGSSGDAFPRCIPDLTSVR